MAQTFSGKAVVSHGPLGKEGWKLEEVETMPDMQDDEMVVEMVASGMVL